MKKNGFILYTTALILGLGIIALKLIFPDLSDMFLLGLAGVIITPLVKESMAQWKIDREKETIELKKKTNELNLPDDS